MTLGSGNLLNYTPDVDFNGQDIFNYTISDGQGGFDTATVSVTVSAINDGPVAADDYNGSQNLFTYFGDCNHETAGAASSMTDRGAITGKSDSIVKGFSLFDTWCEFVV